MYWSGGIFRSIRTASVGCTKQIVLLDYLHVLHGDQGILMLFFNIDCELCEIKCSFQLYFIQLLNSTDPLISRIDSILPCGLFSNRSQMT